MNYKNVNLWFAKIGNGNIVTIDEVDRNQKDKYYCPMCGSELIPKAIKEDAIMSSHFAHIDKSKCSGEGMVHFWFKNKLLIKGDKFIVKTDVSHEYICDEVLVEQSYTIGDKIYRPDVTIIAECGTKIFFEMDYSNKKKVEDYIDIWLELVNPVVEVDVGALMNWNKNKLPEFKALFYKGKCFNIDKNSLYYDTIGKYKEKIYKDSDYNDELKERIKKLDWFWIDVNKYVKNELDIEYMVDLIDIVDEQDREIINEILNKPKCVDLLEKYLNKKLDIVYSIISRNAETKLGEECAKYIRKRIGYDQWNKRKTGEIHILDVSDNCFCVRDISKYSSEDIIRKCDKDIEEIIKYQEQKQLQKNWTNYTENIIDSIKKDKNINKFSKILSNNYEIEFWFRRSYDYKEYLLNVSLHLIGGACADRFELNIIESTTIFDIYKYTEEKVNDYFLSLDKMKIQNIHMLNNIVELLNNKYCSALINDEITIKGRLWLEDSYEISVFCRKTRINGPSLDKRYCISNNGLMDDFRSSKIIYGLTSQENMFEYFALEISKELRKSITYTNKNKGGK